MINTLILSSWLFFSAQEEPTIKVDKLADNVYLYTHNAHRSLFVVTDEGILVTDPQSPESATRYLEEVRKIFAEFFENLAEGRSLPWRT